METMESTRVAHAALAYSKLGRPPAPDPKPQPIHLRKARASWLEEVREQLHMLAYSRDLKSCGEWPGVMKCDIVPHVQLHLLRQWSASEAVRGGLCASLVTTFEASDTSCACELHAGGPSQRISARQTLQYYTKFTKAYKDYKGHQGSGAIPSGQLMVSMWSFCTIRSRSFSALLMSFLITIKSENILQITLPYPRTWDYATSCGCPNTPIWTTTSVHSCDDILTTGDFKPRLSIWTQVAASCSQASDIPSPEVAIASTELKSGKNDKNW